MEGGGGQESLIGSNCGHDLHGLHRMDNVGKSLSTALGPGVGFHGKDYRFVKE